MENPNLTLSDIASIKSIIEATCARGMFKAQEMSHVGALYDKICAFIAYMEPQAQAIAEAHAMQQAQSEEPTQQGEQ